MSYTKRKGGRGVMARARARRMFSATPGVALGGLFDELNALVNVTNDPYAPEVICHIQQLGQVKSGQPVQACAQTASGLPGGVGLDNVATALRYYVYAEQNSWVFPATVAAVIGFPFLLGYILGGD